MNLTTPVLPDNDTEFAGENWFFYWKTSSSLWESKLEGMESETAIVPINWSFHAQEGQSSDFALKRPETDLKRLVEISESLGKRVIFFLPLGPAPFIPNGGVPSYLAREVAVGKDGYKVAVVNSHRILCKVYSYFDNKVFNGFQKFIFELGQYFSRANISSDLYGIHFGSLSEENLEFTPFFFDRSETFQRAYSKFLKNNPEKKVNSSEDEVTGIDKLFEETRKYHKRQNDFQDMVQSMYTDIAKESLGENWEGELRVVLLGGREKEIFHRIYDLETSFDISSQLSDALKVDCIPSAILFPKELKKGVLSKELEDTISKGVLQEKLNSMTSQFSSVGSFSPLILFHLIGGNGEKWISGGLWDYLEGYFPQLFKMQDSREFNWDLEQDVGNMVFTFAGGSISSTHFNLMLKIFLIGGKVLLDTKEMTNENLKRLEVFSLENDLKTEKVKFFTNLVRLSLGEGQFIYFDSSEIEELPGDNKNKFWDSVIESFELDRFRIQTSSPIPFHWKTRPPNHSELKFEEVRRLSFFNPSSYKKKGKVTIPKGHVLLSILDELNVKVQHHKQEVQFELHPQGSFSMDLGSFYMDDL